MTACGRAVAEGGGDGWRRKVDDELKSDVGGMEKRNEFMVLFSHKAFLILFFIRCATWHTLIDQWSL